MQYSIVNLSEILKINPAFRLDAEFYKNEYLENDKFLLKFPLKNISEYSFITDGEHGSPDWDENSNIKYITAENIRPGYILRNEFKTISKDQHKRNDRSRVRENDILLYSVGGRGYVAKAESDLFPCNIPRSVAIIRLNNFNNFLPEYITTFLNTKYGEYQVQRLQAGNIQPMLSLENIKKFQIIELSINFQKEISNIYNTSYSLRQSADNLYQEAENILLEELGLKDYKPQNKKCFTKNLSDIQKAGRFDAEYFQPKYEDVIEKIKEYKGGYNTINKLFDNIKTFFKKEKDKIYKYIEIGDINISNGTYNYNELEFEELPTNAKFFLKKDNIIISQVRPYRGAISIIENDGYVGSGAFTILKENRDKKVNKETLFVFLRLKFMLDFSLKYNTGTSYPTITNEDILNFIVPLLPPSIQSSISSKIQSSFSAREKSKQLLEVAKRAVEIAIEEDEENALKYIKENE